MSFPVFDPRPPAPRDLHDAQLAAGVSPKRGSAFPVSNNTRCRSRTLADAARHRVAGQAGR
jgi:hypothetical protein